MRLLGVMSFLLAVWSLPNFALAEALRGFPGWQLERQEEEAEDNVYQDAAATYLLRSADGLREVVVDAKVAAKLKAGAISPDDVFRRLDRKETNGSVAGARSQAAPAMRQAEPEFTGPAVIGRSSSRPITVVRPAPAAVNSKGSSFVIGKAPTIPQKGSAINTHVAKASEENLYAPQIASNKKKTRSVSGSMETSALAIESAMRRNKGGILASLEFDRDVAFGGRCHYDQVLPEHIYRMPSAENEGNPQHRTVVHLPKCTLSLSNRTIGANIQEGTHFRGWPSKRMFYQGSASLGIRVDPQPSRVTVPADPETGEPERVFNNMKDRFEYVLLPKDLVDNPIAGLTDEDLLKVNGRPRYVGFAIRFHRRYQPPDSRSYAIHFQAHQCCGGNDGGPPLSLKVLPSTKAKDPVMLQLAIRTQDHADSKAADKDNLPSLELLGPPVKDGHPNQRQGIEVSRDAWHTVVLRLEPRDSTQSAGMLEMWLDGKKIYSKKTAWGYDVEGENGDRISLKLGTYRRRHERLQLIHLDSIRYGNTFDEVASPPPSALRGGEDARLGKEKQEDDEEAEEAPKRPGKRAR